MADIDDAVGDAPYGLLTNQYSYQQPDYDPNFGFMGIGTDDVGLGKFNWAHKENFDPTKGFFGVPLTQAQQDRRGRWRENRQARRQRRQEGWGRFKDYFSGNVDGKQMANLPADWDTMNHFQKRRWLKGKGINPLIDAFQYDKIGHLNSLESQLLNNDK